MLKIRKNDKKSRVLSKIEIENRIRNAEKLLRKKSDQSINNLKKAEIILIDVLKYTNELEHSFYRKVINGHLGVLYAQKGDYVKSIYRFSSILLLEPNNELATRNLVKISDKFKEKYNISSNIQLINDVKNDYTYAKELFNENKFEELEPIAFRLIRDYEINDKTSKWISYGNCFMANIASSNNRYSEAIRYYINSLKLYSNNKYADKMITETINEYIDFEKSSIQININEYKDKLNKQDEIIKQKDEKIKQLEKELAILKDKDRTEKLSKNIEDISSREEKDTLLKKDTPNDESIKKSIKVNNEDYSEIKKRLTMLEKENSQYKNRIGEANRYSEKLSNELKTVKKDADKWKNQSKHFETEFITLTEQVENLINIYQQLNKNFKSKEFEESA